MGPLSPINDLAGVLIQQYADDLDKSLETVFQQELAEAKLGGLEKVQSFISSWSHSDDYKYDLLAISSESANKLLQGEFRTFDELYESANVSPNDKEVYVLYREVRNQNRKEEIYIIETLFLNE